MIEQQVSKLSMIFHAMLEKQGDVSIMQSMQQILKDFISTTNDKLKREINLSFQEKIDINDIITGYSFTLKTLISIENGERNFGDINKSIDFIKKTYKLYETKYVQESYHRSKQQNENFIHSILVPLMMIIDFLKKQ